MGMGTDKVLLEVEQPKKVGRPKFDRDLIARYIAQNKTTFWIRKATGASARTIRMIKQELKNKEIAQTDAIIHDTDLAIAKVEKQMEMRQMPKESLEFNEACKVASGTNRGFYEWLTENTKAAKRIFSNTKDVWIKLGSPSILALKDKTMPDGDNFGHAFLDLFLNFSDPEKMRRLRRRKKNIRYLMRYLGRQDINENYFRMKQEREPIEVRRVPCIEMLDFPLQLERVINRIAAQFGIEGELILKLKLASMMRTGKGSEDREMWGIKRGANGETFLLMNGENDYVFEVKSKGEQHRKIQWLPTTVRALLWQIYQKRKDGEQLIQIEVGEFRKAFKEACILEGLPPLHLHDLRKVSITWLWALGVGLDVAIEMNVGWTSMETMHTHYLHLRSGELLKKDKRAIYKANIPEWFKEGLDQYIPDEIKFLQDRIKELEQKLSGGVA
jgi:integrase